MNFCEGKKNAQILPPVSKFSTMKQENCDIKSILICIISQIQEIIEISKSNFRMKTFYVLYDLFF